MLSAVSGPWTLARLISMLVVVEPFLIDTVKSSLVLTPATGSLIASPVAMVAPAYCIGANGMLPALVVVALGAAACSVKLLKSVLFRNDCTCAKPLWKRVLKPVS